MLRTTSALRIADIFKDTYSRNWYSNLGCIYGFYFNAH